jgi:hypothetical protein
MGMRRPGAALIGHGAGSRELEQRPENQRHQFLHCHWRILSVIANFGSLLKDRVGNYRLL